MGRDLLRLSTTFSPVFCNPTHFTNYTERFKGIIDHIFIRNLRVHSTCVMGTCEETTGPVLQSGEWYSYSPEEDWDLNRVTEEVFQAQKTRTPSRYPVLPSRSWPSDHLALLCHLEFGGKDQ